MSARRGAAADRHPPVPPLGPRSTSCCARSSATRSNASTTIVSSCVTVTAVEVEPDLRHAVVFYDSLQGEAGDEEVLDALGELRPRLQARHRPRGPGEADARARVPPRPRRAGGRTHRVRAATMTPAEAARTDAGADTDDADVDTEDTGDTVDRVDGD